MERSLALIFGAYSVVVDYFYIVGVALFPYEAYPPLFVNAYAVQSRTIPGQHLQPVSGRHTEIV